MNEVFIIGILIGFLIGSIVTLALWTLTDEFKNK
jgi:hypothetical protein